MLELYSLHNEVRNVHCHIVDILHDAKLQESNTRVLLNDYKSSNYDIFKVNHIHKK